jgi:GntR family transcriptional regulator, transcriptional repressor for pyruvate dehydrogenase complex
LLTDNRFKPISKKTVSQEIVEQILSLIETGEFKAGEALPSERELSQLFMVGRGSVREAIKVLEASGLIKVTRKGNIVRDKDSNIRAVISFDEDRMNIHELFEARKFMEMELAAVAAERATPKDIEAMKQAIAEKEDEQTAAIAKDIAFHRALVSAAHNSIFSEIYNSLTGILFQHFKYYSYVFDDEFSERYATVTPQDHLKVLESIQSGNRELAREAIKAHLNTAEEKFTAWVEKINLQENKQSPRKGEDSGRSVTDKLDRFGSVTATGTEQA